MGATRQNLRTLTWSIALHCVVWATQQEETLCAASIHAANSLWWLPCVDLEVRWCRWVEPSA